MKKDRTTHTHKQCTSRYTFPGVLGAEAQLRRCLALLILYLLVFAAWMPAVAHAEEVPPFLFATSTFNQGTEGWAAPSITYHQGGFVVAEPPAAGSWFWRAPQAYLGRKGAAYNRTLSFRLAAAPESEDSIATNFDDDVVLVGKRLTLTYDLSLSGGNPGFSMVSYVVLLSEAAWSNQATGAPASEAEMREVLDDLRQLNIRGGFFLNGPGSGALDDVVLNRNAEATISVTVNPPTFDGSASTDPDGEIKEWHWTFGDGTFGQGATTTHTYAPGVYAWNLTVVDNDGLASGGSRYYQLKVGEYDLTIDPQSFEPIADNGSVARLTYKLRLRRGGLPIANEPVVAAFPVVLEFPDPQTAIDTFDPDGQLGISDPVEALRFIDELDDSVDIAILDNAVVVRFDESFTFERLIGTTDANGELEPLVLHVFAPPTNTGPHFETILAASESLATEMYSSSLEATALAEGGAVRVDCYRYSAAGVPDRFLRHRYRIDGGPPADEFSWCPLACFFDANNPPVSTIQTLAAAQCFLRSPRALALAQISQDTYEFASFLNPPPGYTYLTSGGERGFFMNAYLDPNSKIVAAFRGTEIASFVSIILNPLADIGFGTAGVPFLTTLVLADYVAQAQAFVAELRALPFDDSITLTGHSLGGGVAEIIAQGTGLDAVVFNAPGVKFAVNSFNPDNLAGTSNLLNVIVQNDPVHVLPLGGQIGQQVVLQTDKFGSRLSVLAVPVPLLDATMIPFHNHHVSTVVQQIESWSPVIGYVNSDNIIATAPGRSYTQQQLANSVIMPVNTSQTTAGGELWDVKTFDIRVTENWPYVLDPPAALAYVFKVADGNPNFASVTLPLLEASQAPYGIEVFQGGAWQFLTVLEPLSQLVFPQTGGVGEFRVTAINVLNQRPTDPFLAQLTFAGNGVFTGTITAISNPNLPPVARCKDVTVSTSPGTCTASASVNNGSFDPDGDSITLVPSSDASYNLGVNSVTLIVTDSNDASASCTATVTVVDQQPPTLTCPADLTREATGPQGTTVAFSATATDNCSVAPTTSCTPSTGSAFPLGTTSVSCTTTDGVNQSTCSFTVTVVDTTKPTSQVLPLAATQNATNFIVGWSGTDAGTGIKDYTIFISENGGPFTVWLSNTPDTSGTFPGQAGKTYAFYSVARDQTGNLEDAPQTADTTTAVVDTCTPTTVLDNFNRADGSVGNNWRGVTGTNFYRVAGNRLDIQAGGPIYWNPAALGTSQAAFVTLSTVDPKSPSQGVLLKVQSSNVPNAGAIAVVYDAAAKAVRVSTFRLGSLSWTPYDNTMVLFANGDKLGACAKANGEVRVYKNDALVKTVTLSTADQGFFNTKGGKVGVWSVLAPQAFLDDFGGATIAP